MKKVDQPVHKRYGIALFSHTGKILNLARLFFSYPGFKTAGPRNLSLTLNYLLSNIKK